MQEFSAVEYLKIDIANNYGHDKLPWDERIAWVNAQTDLRKLIPEAEAPALFYAGIKALEAVQAGKPIGYPVGLDATASGLQILSVLTGDRSCAEMCNVISNGRRNDAYTTVYEAMKELILEIATDDDPKGSVMLEGREVVRKDAKRALN